MNPFVWDMILGCILGIIIQMFGHDLGQRMINKPSIVIFLVIAISYVRTLMHAIPKRFGVQEVEHLRDAADKLVPVQMTLCRLDPLQRSDQCIEWLNRVSDLQHIEEEIMVGYDECNLNYLKRHMFVEKAGQMIDIANGLFREGENFLHPKKHMQGTMSWYMKKVITFIKDIGDNSAGLLEIWGMGGVGKSSLLKLVRDSRSEYDNEVMFVHAGIGCTVGQVQEVIAISMGLSLARNETSQAKIIHGHLKDTSFLLLLDDLWGLLDLEAVGIPFPLGNQRKVVLTTRKGVYTNKMGWPVCNTIEMKCLDEEDTWRLYHDGWPQVIRVDILLREIPPEQNLSSSRRTRGRSLTRPHLHTVNNILLPVNGVTQEDLLPGQTEYYKEVRSFIEAEGAQSQLSGVWGMRGVGKTALLRLVRDSYTGSACFDHIIFVGAGTGHVVNNVQHAIAVNLGLDWAMMSSLDVLSRATHIFNRLKRKRFLLLLDDIREPLNWWVVGLPLMSNMQQKIILATRTRASCALMGCRASNTMEMLPLRDDDAWKLFRDKAGHGIIDDNPQLHHLAQQMVSQCRGLPLALSSLARAMSNKTDPREWRSAYGQLTAIGLLPSEIDERVGTIILNPFG